MAAASRPPGEPPAWTWAETDLGRWLVAATGAGVCYLGLDGEGAQEALRRWAGRNVSPVAPRQDPCALLETAVRQLEAYARGRLRRFDLPLDLRGTVFQRSVWDLLRAIPYGETRTYGDVAARLGRPGAGRAVGMAAGRNPVPVIVPCHRMVAAGGLGGFSAGLARKRTLLALEGVRLLGRQAELAFEIPA